MAVYTLAASTQLNGTEQPVAGDATTTTFRVATSGSYSGTTTPSTTVPPPTRKVTISGTITLDLTAAEVGDSSRVEDMTGKKLVAVGLCAPSSNSAAITVAPGATNPYAPFGATNEFDLIPGLSLVFHVSGIASGYAAVSSTVKSIDISGTNGDVLETQLWFGD